MRLRPWIDQMGMTVADFAERIGRTETAVNRWLAGTRQPRFEDLRAVYDATDGAVTPNDFVLKGQE